MSGRAVLLSTTMLSGIVWSAVLTGQGAAADLYAKAPLVTLKDPLYLPAVDGLNGKAELLGGTLANKSLYGVRGALAIPVAGQFGVQVDGALGSYDSRAFGAVAAHGFWRDPSRGLLGLYGSYTNWNQAGGLHLGQFGVEGAAYMGRWTVEGVVGVEGGNSQSINFGPAIQTWDIKTRLFDKVDVAYYLNDNWKVSAGHRYLGGNHAAAFGTEYAFNPGWRSGLGMSVFAEARVGENNYQGIWGGLKFYFGQRDKTLIQRHRQDDPPIGLPETLFSLANNRSNSITPVPAAPPPCGECGPS